MLILNCIQYGTNPGPCSPLLMFSEVQDPTTWTTSASTLSLPEDAIISDDPEVVSNNEGSAIYDFWTPLLPRDERDTLGAENSRYEYLGVIPSLDPIMSTTHPGISKANLGYRQSNNYFRKMIEEL